MRKISVQANAREIPTFVACFYIGAGVCFQHTRSRELQTTVCGKLKTKGRP